MIDSIETQSAEYTCEREGDLAVITMGERAFSVVTELGTKSRFIALMDEIEEHSDIRGLALINTRTYPGDERYRAFLDSVMGGGGSARVASSLRVSRYGNAVSQIAMRMSEFSKPLVGGVSGVITGEQLGLMVPCDFRIASNDASFTFPNMSLGFPPTGSLVFYLLQICGQAKTTEILCSTAPLSAEEALKLGLLSRIVDEGEMRQRCIDQLQSLTKLPADAFAATRRMVQPDPIELRRFLDRSQETIWKALTKMDFVS
jgi:enoyl-CoA hydratase/carnithine racemase